jgi:hypothetical protein
VGEFLRLAGAALLGAMISFGTTLYFERRKEQRAERQEAQEHARQRRQALRLVWSEPNEIYAAIEVALAKKHWWTDPPHDLPQQLWNAYRATLAELLDDRAWSQLAEAHGKIAAFNGLLTMGRDGKESIHHGNQDIELIDCCDITEFWQQQLLTTQDPIRWAVEALHPIVQPQNR